MPGHRQRLITAPGLGMLIRGSGTYPVNPALVPGLQQGLSAANLAGQGLAPGDPVSQWNDVSGHNNHATQSGAARPTYNLVSGVPAVLLNGTQYFSNPYLGEPATVIAVARTTATTNQQPLLCAVSNAAGALPAYFIGLDAGFKQYASRPLSADNTTTAAYAFGTAAVNRPNIYVWSFDGATSNVYKDGVRYNSKTVAGARKTIDGPAAIGASYTSGALDKYWSGHLFELWVYNRVLSSFEIANVTEYMFQKYPTIIRPPNIAGKYLFYTTHYEFGTNSSMMLYYSGDGLSNWKYADAFLDPGAGFMNREKSVIYQNGYYWMVYSSSAGSSFGVAKSTDKIFWTKVTEVDCTSILGSGYTQTWSPKWFVDDDGTAWVVFFIWQVTPSDGKPYLVKPTNADMTSWSAFTAINRDSSTSIDYFMTKLGATYYLWYKQESDKSLQYATSSNISGPFLTQTTGDWAGLGLGLEGAVLQKTGADTWRLYVDVYQSTKEAYSNSTNGYTGWAPPTHMSADTEANFYIEHGGPLDPRNPVWPNLISITPSSGVSTASPVAATIAGGLFQQGATVTLNGTPLTGLTVVGPQQITATIPAGISYGALDLRVTNPGGWDSNTLTGAYTVPGPAPTISAINPASGDNNLPTGVTITGTNFYPGATAKVGTTALTGLTVVNSTTITASVPSGLTGGTYDVTVTTPVNQTATLSSSFTVVDVDPIKVQDTFTLADGTAIVGTSTPVGGKVWASPGSAVFQASGNRAYHVSGGNAANTPIVLDSGYSDCTVSASFYSDDFTAQNQRIYGRYTNDSNNLFVSNQNASGVRGNFLSLWKNVAGAATNLGAVAWTWTSGDVIALSMSGTSLVVKANGTNKISVTDSTNQTATKHGIGVGTSTGTKAFDVFTVSVP